MRALGTGGHSDVYLVEDGDTLRRLALKRLRATSEYLDHQFLNDLRPFDQINPSAENIAKFICEEIQKDLKSGSVAYVRVWETDTACAVYRP